jgi:hypothetical protein
MPINQYFERAFGNKKHEWREQKARMLSAFGNKKHECGEQKARVAGNGKHEAGTKSTNTSKSPSEGTSLKTCFLDFNWSL